MACLCNKPSAKTQVRPDRVRCFLLEQSKFTKTPPPPHFSLFDRPSRGSINIEINNIYRLIFLCSKSMLLMLRLVKRCRLSQCTILILLSSSPVSNIVTGLWYCCVFLYRQTSRYLRIKVQVKLFCYMPTRYRGEVQASLYTVPILQEVGWASVPE